MILSGPQFVVETVGVLQKFPVSSAFVHLPILEDENFICVHDGAQAMGDHDRSAAFRGVSKCF